MVKERLYKEVIEKSKITFSTKELLNLGYKSPDLTILANEGTFLKRVKKGYYEFVNDKDLYFYGKRLLNMKKIEEAKRCFQICLQINPNNSMALLELSFWQESDNPLIVQKKEELKKLLEVYSNGRVPRRCKKTDENISDEEIKKLVERLLPSIQKYGIYLLEPMDHKHRKAINKYLNKNSNMEVKSFSINDDTNRRVAIVYKPNNQKEVDSNLMYNKAREYYYSGLYEDAIKNFRIILERPNFIHPYIYSMIGLSYMRLNKIKVAINYLKIADYLFRNKRNFRELIDRLENNKNTIDENYKPNVSFNESDFKDDVEETFGLVRGKVYGVKSLVETGTNVFSACESMGFTEEEVMKMLLIFAKDAYTSREYSLGDKYLKYVERMKNKPKLVKEKIEELRRNKLFYKNRLDNGESRKLIID